MKHAVVVAFAVAASTFASPATAMKQCVPSVRPWYLVTEADVARKNFESETAELVLAKAEEEAADAKAELAAAEKLTTDDAAARIAAAALMLKARQAAVQDAKVDADCASLEANSAWTAFTLWRGGSYLILAPAAAAGVGGTYRAGASAFFAFNDNVWNISELGLGADAVYELERNRVEADRLNKPALGFGPRLRTHFGVGTAAFSLGLNADFLSRPSNALTNAKAEMVLVIAPQVGVRFRSMWTSPKNPDGLGVLGSVRLFLEPRITTDGRTPTAVFFGVELGAGLRLYRSSAASTEYESRAR
jgi:hypothetical protein